MVRNEIVLLDPHSNALWGGAWGGGGGSRAVYTKWKKTSVLEPDGFPRPNIFGQDHRSSPLLKAQILTVFSWRLLEGGLVCSEPAYSAIRKARGQESSRPCQVAAITKLPPFNWNQGVPFILSALFVDATEICFGINRNPCIRPASLPCLTSLITP